MWWKIKIPQQKIDFESISEQLINNGATGSYVEDEEVLIVFFENGFNSDKLNGLLESYQIQNFEIEQHDQEDWFKNSRDFFTPIEIGKFNIDFIVEEKSEGLVKDRNQIYLIPGMGFGSGHHPTTYMMMETMQEIAEGDHKVGGVLDVGCGSGILSVLACKLFKSARVLAIDNDQQALINCKDNLQLNQMGQRIEIDHFMPQRADFDLILANIYLNVLIELRTSFDSLVSKQGSLILSGITVDQEQDLIEQYSDWQILKRNQKDEWLNFVLTKRD